MNGIRSRVSRRNREERKKVMRQLPRGIQDKARKQKWTFEEQKAYKTSPMVWK